MDKRSKQQAEALAYELAMHVEDSINDGVECREPGMGIVTEDTMQRVGYAVDIKPGDHKAEFLVRTDDNTILRVTVSVEP